MIRAAETARPDRLFEVVEVGLARRCDACLAVSGVRIEATIARTFVAAVSDGTRGRLDFT